MLRVIKQNENKWLVGCQNQRQKNNSRVDVPAVFGRWKLFKSPMARGTMTVKILPPKWPLVFLSVISAADKTNSPSWWCTCRVTWSRHGYQRHNRWHQIVWAITARLVNPETSSATDSVRERVLLTASALHRERQTWRWWTGQETWWMVTDKEPGQPVSWRQEWCKREGCKWEWRVNHIFMVCLLQFQSLTVS